MNFHIPTDGRQCAWQRRRRRERMKIWKKHEWNVMGTFHLNDSPERLSSTLCARPPHIRSCARLSLSTDAMEFDFFLSSLDACVASATWSIFYIGLECFRFIFFLFSVARHESHGFAYVSIVLTLLLLFKFKLYVLSEEHMNCVAAKRNKSWEHAEGNMMEDEQFTKSIKDRVYDVWHRKVQLHLAINGNKWRSPSIAKNRWRSKRRMEMLARLVSAAKLRKYILHNDTQLKVSLSFVLRSRFVRTRANNM